MIEYHKIQTVFYRDPETNHKRLIEGAWSKPEFDYLQSNLWQIDEKIDGTNIRVMWDGVDVKIGGKTDDAMPMKELYSNILALFPKEKMEAQFGAISLMLLQKPLDVCLYGEGYGAGVQKGGGNYRKDKSFILFDVKIGPLWLERKTVREIAASLGLDMVPDLGVMPLSEAIATCKVGFSSAFGDFPAEGIIARPLVEMKNRRGERIITKLKCKDYHYVQG